jgi:hypothetical protein
VEVGALRRLAPSAVGVAKRLQVSKSSVMWTAATGISEAERGEAGHHVSHINEHKHNAMTSIYYFLVYFPVA